MSVGIIESPDDLSFLLVHGIDIIRWDSGQPDTHVCSNLKNSVTRHGLSRTRCIRRNKFFKKD